MQATVHGVAEIQTRLSNFTSLQFSKKVDTLVAQMVKNPPVTQENRVQSLGWEDRLVTRMATHSRILAYKIPWTEGAGGMQPMRSQRVGHD